MNIELTFFLEYPFRHQEQWNLLLSRSLSSGCSFFLCLITLSKSKAIQYRNLIHCKLDVHFSMDSFFRTTALQYSAMYWWWYSAHRDLDHLELVFE